MDLYLLNGKLERDLLIDRYTSLVWTERFSDLGDFTLELPAITRWRTRLRPGKLLSYEPSRRVMVIVTTEDAISASGERTFKVSGHSLESLLGGRVAMHATNPTWSMTDIPGKIVRRMVDDVCRVGTLGVREKIPFLTLGTLFPPDTILEPFEEITIEIDTEVLYDFVKNICDAYDMGFRLCLNPNNRTLVFEVYMGRDLTSGAPDVEPVIFAMGFGNLEGSSLVKSSTYYASTALVVSQQGRLWVNRGDGSERDSGFARRVLLVESSQITPEWPSARAQQQMRVDGQKALAASRHVVGFDGQISKTDSYTYGVDYNVGDIVEVRSENNEQSRMRVTEQIMTNDANGEQSYPTLMLMETYADGSWMSQDGDGAWSEAGTTTWANASDLSP